MTNQPARRTVPISFVSLAIASLSMVTAMYQGWLQTENMASMTRDIARREQIRVCKDVIEAYFEAKLRIGLLADKMGRTELFLTLTTPSEQAAVAVSRIGAFGTFLANVQGEDARARYTSLTRELETVLEATLAGAVTDRDGLFREADRLFAVLNEDCVASARLMS